MACTFNQGGHEKHIFHLHDAVYVTARTSQAHSMPGSRAQMHSLLLHAWSVRLVAHNLYYASNMLQHNQLHDEKRLLPASASSQK